MIIVSFYWVFIQGRHIVEQNHTKNHLWITLKFSLKFTQSHEAAIRHHIRESL